MLELNIKPVIMKQAYSDASVLSIFAPLDRIVVKATIARATPPGIASHTRNKAAIQYSVPTSALASSLIVRVWFSTCFDSWL